MAELPQQIMNKSLTAQLQAAHAAQHAAVLDDASRAAEEAAGANAPAPGNAPPTALAAPSLPVAPLHPAAPSSPATQPPAATQLLPTATLPFSGSQVEREALAQQQQHAQLQAELLAQQQAQQEVKQAELLARQQSG